MSPNKDEIRATPSSAIDSYLYGFVMQELSLRPIATPQETAAMAVTFLDHFPAEEYPDLAELTTQHVLRPGYDYGNEFGVRARPDPRRPRTGPHSTRQRRKEPG